MRKFDRVKCCIDGDNVVGGDDQECEALNGWIKKFDSTIEINTLAHFSTASFLCMIWVLRY